MIRQTHTRILFARFTLGCGALAVLATGADHLQQYTANQFSTVPTIGALFLLNFIAATGIGTGLLTAALGRRPRRFADELRGLMAISGIGLAATSLIALLISESSSLFGFTDHGYRPAIVAAIAAEAVAIVALGAHLALAGIGLSRRIDRARARPRTGLRRPPRTVDMRNTR